MTEDVFESTAFLFSPLFQGKGSICLWHPRFIQESQGIQDLTACMPWKLKGRIYNKTYQSTCLPFLYSTKRKHLYFCSLSLSLFSIMPNATAVHAVQFLCNFGAALQEKCLLMCMSYLLASFFISCLSILDSFSLLVLINFHVSNVFVKKEKTVTLTPSPHPPLYVQEF